MSSGPFERISLVCLLLAGFLITAPAAAQSGQTLKEQVVGSWKLSSVTNTRADGTKYELFGPNATGILMLDSNGRYSLQIFRRDRPAFAGARLEGTAEENKAAVQGMISHFGTYDVNEADRSITFRIESSSYPNWDHTEQKRSLVLLVNQLSWADPVPVSGPQSTDLQSNIVWQRVVGGQASRSP